MGTSSKVILVGATALIVGAYAVSLKKAESSGFEAAMKAVKRVQNERIEDAAIRIAIDEFVNADGSKDMSGSKKSFGDSRCSYDIKQHGIYADVTVTVEIDGVKKTIVARLDKKAEVQQGPRKIHRGSWQVTKISSRR